MKMQNVYQVGIKRRKTETQTCICEHNKKERNFSILG